MTGPRNRERSFSSGAHVWIYGWHAVIHALNNVQRRWDMLYVTQAQWQKIQHLLGMNTGSWGAKVRIVEPADLDARLGRQVVHQGVALQAYPLAPCFLDDLPAFQEDGRPTWVVGLDHIEDPQNLGGIIRTAATFGAHGLIVTDRHAPPVTSTVLKTASGGVEHTPIIAVTNLTRALETLKIKGFWVIGLAEEGDQWLDDADFTQPMVMVMGSEGSGLRHLTKKTCDQLLRLPTSAVFSTLNVGAAFSVAAYECVRQRAAYKRP